MFEEIRDLIIILTPSGLHYEHSNLALNFGFNVLVEKPICLLPADAEKLYKKAKSKKLLLGVGFQNRYNKAIVFKNALIKNYLEKLFQYQLCLDGVDFKIIIQMIGMVHGNLMVE